MKFSLSPLAVLIIPAILGLPAEAAAAASPIYNPSIEARLTLPVNGVTTADVIFRTCPRTTCGNWGTFKKGQEVSILCYSEKDTETVNGNPRWASIEGTPSNAWVPIGYVSSKYPIIPC